MLRGINLAFRQDFSTGSRDWREGEGRGRWVTACCQYYSELSLSLATSVCTSSVDNASNFLWLYALVDDQGNTYNNSLEV
jgi:hypothetical protein